MGSARTSLCAPLPREIKIRMYFKRPVRLPMWIATISICSLAVLGNHCDRPFDPGLIRQHSNGECAVQGSNSAGPVRGRDCRGGAIAPCGGARYSKTQQPGVVPWMRRHRIDATDGTAREHASARCCRRKSCGSLILVAHPAAQSPVVAQRGRVYEFTVRFRDRSTMSFSEASPRAWSVGTPVMVIGSLNSANN